MHARLAAPAFVLVAAVASPVFADSLAVPSSLQASASGSEIRLSWSSSSGAQSYVVMRGTDSYSLRDVTTTSSTYYSDRDVKPGVTYYYAVKAKRGSDTSKPSQTAHAGATLGPPSGVSARADSHAVRLSWNSVSGVSSYVVLRSSDSSSSFRELTTTSSTNYTDNDIKPGTSYRYVVRSKAGSTQSANSSEAKVGMGVDAPSSVSASSGSSTSIKLSWSSVSGVESYVVMRDTSSSGYSYREVNSTSSTSYTDSGLKPATTYYYVVKAKRGGAKSQPSRQASATTSK